MRLFGFVVQPPHVVQRKIAALHLHSLLNRPSDALLTDAMVVAAVILL